MNKITTTNSVFPPQIAWLFQKQPLLLGESRRDYDQVCKSLIRSIQPENHLEWLLVKQAVDYCWEIIRLSKFKAAIVNMTWREALQLVLETIVGGDEDERRRAVQEHVDGWYTTPEAQQATIKLLEKHLINTDDITAQAMALRLPELERIDRSLEKNRAGLNATLREIEHYRIAGIWKGGKDLQQIVDAELSSIIPAPGGPITNFR